MSKARRGFASMSPAKRREVASKGGKACHAQGTGHEWTPAEARAVGKKGGLTTRSRRTGESLEDLLDGTPDRQVP